MRIGIIGLLQESNTFLAERTGLREFAADVLARGDRVRDLFQSAPHEIGGFLAGLAAAGFEAVPLLVARALPYGVVEAGALEELVALMLAELRSKMPLDGLLVAPHGATVAEHQADADGYWLDRVRTQVGPHIPIIGTIDLHANLSQRMVAACDALIAYRTNPHLDQRERGAEAAYLMIRMLRKEIHPTMSAAYPPLALGIERQATNELPCRKVQQWADDVRLTPGVLSASVVLGFPYADVPEMGASAIVVTDNDRPLAKRLAAGLASKVWGIRHEFVTKMLGVCDAVDIALNAEPPVCLLDMGDNVGGGAPADSTWLAHELICRRIARSLVVIRDEDAVRDALRAGIGNRWRGRIGGRSGPLSGPPIEHEFKVERVADGRSVESRATHGGFTSFDFGRTAVLAAEAGPTIVATSGRMVPFSLGQLRSCGLEPAAYRLLVAKGVHAPVAAYREVCRTFVRVDTPGVTTADMTTLAYCHRRRPMFPFEADCSWSISDDVRSRS